MKQAVRSVVTVSVTGWAGRNLKAGAEKRTVGAWRAAARDEGGSRGGMPESLLQVF